MAVSGLEQRVQPLVETMSVWNPWGPLKVPPRMDDDSEEEEEECFAARWRPRSRSWSNYARYEHRVSYEAEGGAVSYEAKGGASAPLTTRPYAPLTTAPLRRVSAFLDQRLPSSTFGGAVGDVEKHCHKGKFDGDISDGETESTCGRSTFRPGYGSFTTQEDSASESGDVCADAILTEVPIRTPGPAPTPKAVRKQSVEVASKVETGKPVTTLMVRNLPPHLGTQDFLDELHRCGFEGLYDYCYLPRKFSNGKGMGFAFINFATAEVARAFSDDWHNTRRFGKTARLDIAVAALQGLAANSGKACSRKVGRIRNKEFRPLLLDAAQKKAP